MDRSIVVALVYCLIRDWMHAKMVRELTSKLMSKNYNDYKYAEEAYRPKEENRIPVPEDIPDDLDRMN